MLSSHLKSLVLSTISDSVYSYLKNPNNFIKRIIITSYHWPDLDGIASAYALSALLQKRGYKNIESMIWQEPQDEAKWVMNQLDFSIPQINLKGNEEFILVDVSNLDIPSFIPVDRVSVVIDHRDYYNANAFPNAGFWIKSVGSAASLITSLYILFNIMPDQISANLLYSAIMSNTITCKTHNTTDLDKAAVAWLENFISLHKNFVEEMFMAKSQITDIKKRIDDDLSSVLQPINDKKTAVAQLEIVDVQKFLNNNKDAVMDALVLIKKERNAESLFLVAVDIKNFSTFFCFLEKDTEKFVSNFIPFDNFCNYFYKINDIFTRKEIIAILQ